MPYKEDVTLDGILDWFYRETCARTPISTSQWLDAALKMTVLVQDLDNELIEAEINYRTYKASLIDKGQTAAGSDAFTKASPFYSKYLKLKAKRERIAEFIMVAKKRAQLEHFDR